MKNLAKHKIAVKTREVLVQAIYQHLFEKTISKKMEIKENEIELIDKAILCLGIIEMNNEMAPRPVVIDECIRLTKKFSNPESYKFINASLDKI